MIKETVTNRVELEGAGTEHQFLTIYCQCGESIKNPNDDLQFLKRLLVDLGWTYKTRFWSHEPTVTFMCPDCFYE